MFSRKLIAVHSIYLCFMSIKGNKIRTLGWHCNEITWDWLKVRDINNREWNMAMHLLNSQLSSKRKSVMTGNSFTGSIPLQLQMMGVNSFWRRKLKKHQNKKKSFDKPVSHTVQNRLPYTQPLVNRCVDKFRKSHNTVYSLSLLFWMYPFPSLHLLVMIKYQ